MLLVSHDRAFINNSVTSTLVFDAPGRIEAYAGGYDDWLLQRSATVAPNPDKPLTRRGKKPMPPPVTSRKKLGYMEQRELAELPGRIESLEVRQQELFATMSQPDFYRRESEQIANVKQDLASVEQELETAFARWEKLESIDQS